MKFEMPKALTEEQKRETKSRIISDAELIKGGAYIKDDGSIKASDDQIRNIEQMHLRGRFTTGLNMDDAEGQKFKKKMDIDNILDHETPEDREFYRLMKEVDDIDFDEE